MATQAPANPPATPENGEETPGAFPDSASDEEVVHVSSDLNSLSRAVRARKAEYTRRRRIRVRVGSWNVAALPGTENDIGNWFVQRPVLTDRSVNVANGGEGASGISSTESRNTNESKGESGGAGLPKNQEQEPGSDEPSSLESDDGSADIYVLGLQEVVDVSSPTEALRPYVDVVPSKKWKDALQKALPPGYELISSQQLIGLLLLVYATPSIAEITSSVSSTSVGTGVMGYMGNKGAVATRIVLGGTTRLVFVNCHLSAGGDKANLERRNWDTTQIISRMKFDPVEEQDDILEKTSQVLGDEEFSFWFGDLNYRLDGIPGGDVRRLLHLHTENEFHSLRKKPASTEENVNTETYRPTGTSFEENVPPETTAEPISLTDNDMESYIDPASLQNTIFSLLPHDQLHAQQKKRNAFHDGWREGTIDFLPTYKYDVGRIGKFDSSEKQRSPSWCDRILYRTRHDYLEYQRKVKEEKEAKRRDDEMKNLGLEQEAEDDSVLFDYDPDLDGADYDPENDAADDTAGSLSDSERQLDDMAAITRYTSHPYIVSSDHKPIHADFILTFDATIPELKAKVHQEVVRVLDKAENEARPDITVVMDDPSKSSDEKRGAAEDTYAPDVINFTEVRYDVPVSRSLTLANTGGVPATFSFRYNPIVEGDDAVDSPPWLSIRVDWPPDNDNEASKISKEYTLPPGESAHVEIVLCICDIDFVRELNIRKANVEDIIVLRVANGRDNFLSVRGNWLPSCFGFSLEELIRMPEEGARFLADTSNGFGSLENDDKAPIRLSAPRELFKLTEAVAELTERSVAEWGMVCNDDFSNETCPWRSEHSGWPFDPETWTLKNTSERDELLACVREALDTNTSFASHLPLGLPWKHQTELLGETLVSFLRSIRGGIITEPLWNELEHHQKLSRERSKQYAAGFSSEQIQTQVLETLSSSPAHSVSFTFLTFMLNRIANEIAPVTPITISGPTSPSVPTTPTKGQTSDVPEPTPISPSSPTPAAKSSLPFSFRLKSRSRGTSTSNGNDMSNSIPQSNPTVTRREAVNKSLASIFSNVIFSNSIKAPEKDKERKAWNERRRGIIEPFLQNTGV